VLIPGYISAKTSTSAYYYLEATYVSGIQALTPAAAAVLGYIFFGEKLTALQIVGIALVISAVVYIQMKEGESEAVLEDVMGKKMPLEAEVSPIE
jgi:drug/metabolite transporter (DMT)-like permease